MAPPPVSAIPPVHHVAGQLGRALVQGVLDRVDDQVDRLLDRLAHLGRGDHHRLRQAADQVPAPDLGVRLVIGGNAEPRPS
jgi:hypothetical protein